MKISKANIVRSTHKLNTKKDILPLRSNLTTANQDYLEDNIRALSGNGLDEYEIADRLYRGKKTKVVNEFQSAVGGHGRFSEVTVNTPSYLAFIRYVTKVIGQDK